jgi:hypothetical protein
MNKAGKVHEVIKKGERMVLLWTTVRETISSVLSISHEDVAARWTQLQILGLALRYVYDEEDAQTVEQILVRPDLYPDLSLSRMCNGCKDVLRQQNGPYEEMYFACRDCADTILCQTCMKSLRTSEILLRGCSMQHSFLEHPCLDLCRLKPGMVTNDQTEVDWLRALGEKYSEKNEEAAIKSVLKRNNLD